MKRAVILIAACLACGCSTVSTEFIDQDGTTFRQELSLAPFSKLDEQAAQMLYQWSGEGGNIAVGTATTNLDNTGQTEALKAILQAAMTAAAAFATQGAPTP